MEHVNASDLFDENFMSGRRAGRSGSVDHRPEQADAGRYHAREIVIV
jgi:hypothetical protein